MHTNNSQFDFVKVLVIIIVIVALILLLGYLIKSFKKNKPFELEAINIGGDSFYITKANQEDYKNLEKDLLIIHFLEDYKFGSSFGVNIKPQIAESYPGQAQATSSDLLAEKAGRVVIDFELAKRIFLHKDNSLLIDVRSKAEYQEGHVPNAINIPVDNIESDIDDYIDAETIIIVYCRSGRRSKKASEILLDKGIPLVFDAQAISKYDGALVTGD